MARSSACRSEGLACLAAAIRASVAASAAGCISTTKIGSPLVAIANRRPSGENSRLRIHQLWPGIVATSLFNELPATPLGELDRNSLACRVLESLHAEFQRIDDDFSSAIAEVRTRSWLLGRQIRAQAPQGEVFGRVLDLNEEGHLILQFPDGSTHTLTSADEVRRV